MNSFDARVRYTKMVIEESFLELLRQKPVSKITVTELCQKAQINRATFYKHYMDVPDLLEKLEEQLLEQIRSFFEEHPAPLEIFLTDMLRYMQREGQRTIILGSDNGDPNLMTRTFQLCYELAYPLLEQNLPKLEEGKRRMLYYFLSHGCGGILTCWIREGMKEPPEEVTAFLLELCQNTANTFQG